MVRRHTLKQFLLLLWSRAAFRAKRARLGELLGSVLGLFLTLGLAFGSGWLFEQLGLVVPYLLGSMLGVWSCALLLGPLDSASKSLFPRGLLQIPRGVQVSVITLLSVFIGSFFSPELFGRMQAWSFTLILLLLLTGFVTFLAWCYLVKVRRYDRRLALLCAVPGGQAEMSFLARSWAEKSPKTHAGSQDYVVGLCHLVRVVAVFGLAPFITDIYSRFQAESQTSSSFQAAQQVSRGAELATSETPGLVSRALPFWEVGTDNLFLYVVLGVSGYGLGRLCRLPSPQLLGPLFLSAVLHTFRLIALPGVQELLLGAQLILGSYLGLRLRQVRRAHLKACLLDGLVVALMVLGIYGLASVFAARFVSNAHLEVFLAFVPGGIYEMSLLAVLFHFDLAFIAFHHVARLLFILLLVPFLARYALRA